MDRNNWLDGLISFLSPMSAVKRAHARAALAVMRKYEAASVGGRTGGWKTVSGGSANAEVGPALHIIRARSRDLVRNQPYATKAISVIETNTVGAGIVYRIKKSGGGAPSPKFGPAWQAWADTTDCDYDGMNSLYGLQALTMRTVAESGEALIIRRWRSAKGGRMPFQLQVLEGDYLDTLKTFALDNGGHILYGVEFDAAGNRVAYWVFPQHPGELLMTGFHFSLTSIRIPAKDVLHVYKIDRPGQVRGIAWAAPVIIRLKDFDEYEDAELVRMKVAAMFAGFIHDLETPEGLTQAQNKALPLLEPGIMERLPPGTDITFPNLPNVQDNGRAARILRSIAAGFGVSAESLSGDLSGISFSAGRMGWIEMHRNVQKWQWLMLVPRMCVPVFEWFKEGCDLNGIPVDGLTAQLTTPRRDMINPTEETSATISAVRAGIKTLPEAIREQGDDPDKVFQEIAETNKLLDKLGIIVDTDPRRIMKAGILQTPTAAELTPKTDGESAGTAASS